MSLKLDHMRGLVRTEKAFQTLRREVARELGPIIDVNVSLHGLAEAVNDRLQVLVRTGRGGRLNFNRQAMERLAVHPDSEVRRMAVQLLPESGLLQYGKDRDAGVRAAVAARSSLTQVREMMRNFPRDDELRAIYNRRKPQEQAPKVLKEDADKGFDLHGDGPMGDSSRSIDDELSDDFYVDLARRLVADYDREIETGWEEKAVRNVVRAYKATSNVELDGEKLLELVKELLTEKDDVGMDEGDQMTYEGLTPLQALARSLREAEANAAHVFPILESDENADPVFDLLRSSLTPEAYIAEATRIFNVRSAELPAAVRKYGTGGARVTRVPMKGNLPGGHLREHDERALDLFVGHWNGRQALTGEPFRLGWDPDPSTLDGVGFHVSLT